MRLPGAARAAFFMSAMPLRYVVVTASCVLSRYVIFNRGPVAAIR